ncbi:MAG: LysR family transcriptional regulator [Lachnospiraceae bacterium]|nr:LysR family transcriptional regulator [Lachnospiraceae bacterium]
MNLEYLQEFLMLAQTGSYSRACEMLFMNQSTLSKHIKALEESLGVTLFDRNTRSVELTEYGEQLYPYAKQISQLHYQYRHELNRKKLNLLTIGSIPSMPQYHITELISRFKQTHPKIKIQIDEADSNDLIKHLMRGSVDVAFLRFFTPSLSAKTAEETHLTLLPHAQDHLVAMIPKGHCLYGQKSLSFQDLESHRLCLLPEKTMFYEVIINAFRNAGVVPNIYYTSHRPINLLAMSAKEQCIALVLSAPFLGYESALENFRERFFCAEVTPTISSTLSLGYPEDAKLSTPARQFIEFFTKEGSR